jgi:hypothetical protein
MKNSTRSQKQVRLSGFAWFVLVLLFGAQGLSAQITLSYSYPEYTMEGDTIWHNFPPPDSSYFHNRIGIKFARGRSI